MRIASSYPNYLRTVYDANPNLEKQPFEKQYRRVMDDAFGWADFFSQALAGLGYEAWEPISNAEVMQKAWAKEHSINISDKDWVREVVIAQTRHFRPDVLFVPDYVLCTPAFCRHLRQVCGSIKLVVGWCSAPYHDHRVFEGQDILLTSMPRFVTKFRSLGFNAHQMYHAFHPPILRMLHSEDKSPIPFSFVGSIFNKIGLHKTRAKLVTHLVQHTALPRVATGVTEADFVRAS
jgi:spore maturation protein CgeB